MLMAITKTQLIYGKEIEMTIHVKRYGHFCSTIALNEEDLTSLSVNVNASVTKIADDDYDVSILSTGTPDDLELLFKGINQEISRMKKL
jgi:formylmethanofuran dehydrogenase subunit D